ncbi:MAG: UDP-3-O-(3-hydroxymyristoyl)glucosamine N-acyltransferase [Planctomycetota bacterium]|jgi:UDP-3-O-[3-hydroxymyristoyl] glucosamine N-acyltransferase
METLGSIADAVDGVCEGPSELPLDGLSTLEHAGPRDLVFVKDERHLARLGPSRAGAVLCRPGDDVGGRPAIRVANPRMAAALAVAVFRPPPPVAAGVHPTAHVAGDAVVPETCHLGPFAVVDAGARLGAGVVVEAHAVVGAGCRVGDETRLYPHVVLYPGVTVGARCHVHAGAVIGSPGFGYEMGAEGPIGFPQNGTVILGDEVRIGANTTIDRATLTETRLGDGVKVDNLVQIGHNVTVGDGVIICAQSGIAGGATFEDRSVMGPQGALAPNAVLGRGTILSARSALIDNQRLDAPGEIYTGVPAMPVRDWRRLLVLRRKVAKRR